MHKTKFHTWKNYFLFLRRAYDIQLFCCQQKLLLKNLYKYPISNHTHFMIEINNSVHELHQDDIMFRRILMLRTNMLKSFIVTTIFCHSNFVFRIKKYMVSEDLSGNIMCGLIQN